MMDLGTGKSGYTSELRDAAVLFRVPLKLHVRIIVIYGFFRNVLAFATSGRSVSRSAVNVCSFL